ncbi:MAG: Mut7-C RNAse domain-containing protein [Syntrophobacterales bacterium]|nr:Mut7-C RNAse domain-containing protein [Syntrophobacterales bacterium]
MKFLVDAPLGGLARRLRFLGLDARLTVLRPEALPAPQAGLVLLTTNRRLEKAAREDLLILAAREPEAQLDEVVRRLQLTRAQLRPLSRCVRCNIRLRELPRAQAAERVPEHIWVTQTEFYHCPACGRVYWPGSHVAGISRSLAGVLGEEGRPRGPSPSTRSSV